MNEKQLTPIGEAIKKVKDKMSELEELRPFDPRIKFGYNDYDPEHRDWMDRWCIVNEHLEDLQSLLPKEEESHIQMHLKGQRSMHGGGSRIWAESAFNETFKTESNE